MSLTPRRCQPATGGSTVLDAASGVTEQADDDQPPSPFRSAVRDRRATQRTPISIWQASVRAVGRNTLRLRASPVVGKHFPGSDTTGPRRSRHPRRHPTSEGVPVSHRTQQKPNVKKQGQTLKEKRAAKKVKKLRLADAAVKVPATGR